mmetsp:Transcript_16561/g.33588  ORF Transcript_16561/g.33588 Transcript_16561/m.33588 type:complete len:155 (-) Transcript_16561:412-876(-)
MVREILAARRSGSSHLVGLAAVGHHQVAVEFVVARVHCGVAFVETPLMHPHQASDDQGADHEYDKDDRGEALVHGVLPRPHLFRCSLDFWRTFCVELHVEHEARRQEEKHDAPLDTEDRPLAPNPHAIVLIEVRCFVETGGASCHQSYREEQLQ